MKRALVTFSMVVSVDVPDDIDLHQIVTLARETLHEFSNVYLFSASANHVLVRENDGWKEIMGGGV